MDYQQPMSSFTSIDSTVFLHSSDLSDRLFPRQTKVFVINRNCTNSKILISNAADFDHPLTTTTTSTSLPPSIPYVIHLPLKYTNCPCSFFKAIYILWIYSPPVLPWCLSGKEPTCRCRRLRFDSWVGKIPQRWKWSPIGNYPWKWDWSG